MSRHLLDPPWGIQFRKSSHSADHQACVEVAVASDVVGGCATSRTGPRQRTTTRPPRHYYPSTESDAFIRGVKDGEFD